MQLEKKSFEGKIISFLKGNSAIPAIQCFIEGISTKRGSKVINSITENNELLYQWKIKIADEVNKGKNAFISLGDAAVSLSFFFYCPFHGNVRFDAENFVKPVIDGLAKGLFSANWKQEKVQAIKVRFNEDDSVFRWIYFEYHETVKEFKEGVYVTVWTSE